MNKAELLDLVENKMIDFTDQITGLTNLLGDLQDDVDELRDIIIDLDIEMEKEDD